MEFGQPCNYNPESMADDGSCTIYDCQGAQRRLSWRRRALRRRRTSRFVFTQVMCATTGIQKRTKTNTTTIAFAARVERAERVWLHGDCRLHQPERLRHGHHDGDASTNARNDVRECAGESLAASTRTLATTTLMRWRATARATSLAILATTVTPARRTTRTTTRANARASLRLLVANPNACNFNHAVESDGSC